MQTGLLKPASQSSAMEKSLSLGLKHPDSMSITTVQGGGVSQEPGIGLVEKLISKPNHLKQFRCNTCCRVNRCERGFS